MTNIVLQLGGVIPATTAAFQQYALGVLLSNATFLVEKWKLDVPLPIQTNSITLCEVKAKTNGLCGTVQLLNRYAFTVCDQRLDTFRDLGFFSKSFSGNDARAEALLKMTNHLTLETAKRLALDSILAIGIDPERLRLGEPEKEHQWMYDWDGEMMPLPLYTIRWNSDSGIVEVQVSGVTSNVASLFQITPALRVHPPTNYLEMLGLPKDATFIDWTRR
jgi:hypothetical protein